MEGEFQSDEARLARLLLDVREWSDCGEIPAAVLAQLVDEAKLPARLYAGALAEIERGGIVVVPGVGGASNVRGPAPEGRFGVDGLSLFFRRTRHELLTSAQEIEFGRRMERGRLAEEALTAGERLDVAVRHDLVQQAEDGRAAFEEFASTNVRLVVSIARAFRSHTGPGLDFEDLIQEGYLGLTRALQKWDHARGWKFSTYASWWIRQSIRRAIADKGSTIRLPVHVHETLGKVHRAEQQIIGSGRRVTADRIARRTGIPESKVKDLLHRRNRVESLHRLVGDDGGVELAELCAAADVGDPEVLAEKALLRTDIEAALGVLRPSEAEVIRRRFGFAGGAPETLEEVAQDFGVTRERIRQIQVRALERLRTAKAGHLRTYAETPL